MCVINFKEMKERMNVWSKEKSALNAKVTFVRPKRRQIWWCAIGFNVGSEQNCTEGFDRPVLVLKVFGSMFWGLPITSSDPEKKKEENPLYFKIDGIPYATTEGKAKCLVGYVALHQLRSFDSRRLKRKILRMDNEVFDKIEDKVRSLL